MGAVTVPLRHHHRYRQPAFWQAHFGLPLVTLPAALRAGNVEEAVEVSRKHVDILHRTMFMGLAEGGV